MLASLSDVDSPPIGSQNIVLSNTGKRFGDVVALGDVNLNIESGTVALLGRNGAGKSTMLNLLTGVQRPTDGEVLVGGHVPGSEGAAALVSRQLEFPGTASFLNPKKIIRLLDMTPEEAERFIENLRLFEVPDRPMGKLSRGNQLKVALAVSFARDRPILLLDEPTSGLDVFGVEIVSELIGSRNRREFITITATHQPTLTPELFDRALVVENGVLLFDGGLPELLDLAPDSPENSTPTARLAAAFIELLRRERR